MCDVVNNSHHLRSSRGGFNDIRSFYSTIYTTSFNKDFAPTKGNGYCNSISGYVTNVKPYVSLTPNWDSNSKSEFFSDQFVTVTDRDYKSFKFPNGHEITPGYFLKGNLSRFGKERAITTPLTKEVCPESDRNVCINSSENSDAFRMRRANPYTERDLFLSNIVPNKFPRRLGTQVYELSDPKSKLKPWDNLPVTSEDYIDPFLYKSIKHNPSVNMKAVRTTGISLPKPLSGEDWYPFDRKIEKSKSDSNSTRSSVHVSKLDERGVNRDPCRIINAKYPRLVSIQGADYGWPNMNYGWTPRTMAEYNKRCMPSAYSNADKSNVLPQTSRSEESSFATETAREFVHQSLADFGNKGYNGNFSRVGLNDPRVMRQEEMRIPIN